jgi:hypothetical protein
MDESRFAPPAGNPAQAFSLAAEMLEIARERFSEGDLQAALDGSRDCIRLASSAILFRDGYVTDDFGKTVQYLSRRYDSIFPLREWERVEMTYLGSGGMYKMILKMMGKTIRSDQELVDEALTVAQRFVETARRELGT